MVIKFLRGLILLFRALVDWLIATGVALLLLLTNYSMAAMPDKSNQKEAYIFSFVVNQSDIHQVTSLESLLVKGNQDIKELSDSSENAHLQMSNFSSLENQSSEETDALLDPETKASITHK